MYLPTRKVIKMKTELLQVRIPGSTKETIKEYAKKNDVSMSEAIRSFIRNGLSKNIQKTRRKI